MFMHLYFPKCSAHSKLKCNRPLTVVFKQHEHCCLEKNLAVKPTWRSLYPVLTLEIRVNYSVTSTWSSVRVSASQLLQRSRRDLSRGKFKTVSARDFRLSPLQSMLFLQEINKSMYQTGQMAWIGKNFKWRINRGQVSTRNQRNGDFLSDLQWFCFVFFF